MVYSVLSVALIVSAYAGRRTFHEMSNLASRGFMGSSLNPSVSILAPQAPVIDDVPIQDITSIYSQDLQSQIEDATREKEKNAYTSLSAEDLKIDVKMDTIQSNTKYVVPIPPSPCDTSTGPAAKLFSCGTTLAPVVLEGFPSPPQEPAFRR